MHVLPFPLLALLLPKRKESFPPLPLTLLALLSSSVHPFPGGITWDDLEKKHKLDPARAQEVRKQRIGYFWEIFEKFGVVVKKKDFILSKRHCFVTYADKDAFEKVRGEREEKSEGECGVRGNKLGRGTTGGVRYTGERDAEHCEGSLLVFFFSFFLAFF